MKTTNLLAIACALLCACTRQEATDAEGGALHLLPGEVPPRPSLAEAAAAGTPVEAAKNPPAEAGVDLRVFETRAPVWGKSIGHTSVVFKLKLEGGAQAAYKPHSHRGGSRYKGEIAAYRLARALGLSNVPPALPRSFPWTALDTALGGDATDAGRLLREETRGDVRGNVHGAIIPWIDRLTFVALEAEPMRSSWRSWLAADGSIPEDKKKLAAEISTMIVFDYLTGNWDRWSGGNIGMQEGGDTLLFIDNDGAFFDPPPPAPLAKQRALLEDDSRYSRSFVAALRSLRPDVLREAVGDVEPGESLLSARVLDGVETRRMKALAVIEAKVAALGESSVLAFE